jgi:hypothetical protein
MDHPPHLMMVMTMTHCRPALLMLSMMSSVEEVHLRVQFSHTNTNDKGQAVLKPPNSPN